MDFKHYLVFETKRVEILEPIGFDGFASTLSQERSRFGRDVFFGGDEELSLSFTKEFGDVTENVRMLDNGVEVSHITSGFDLLLDEFNLKGNEAKILYEIEQDGFVVNIGQLFRDKTDGLSYIDCKTQKVSEEADYEVDSDTSVDLFGTNNLKGETITPIETQKMLLLAKPEIQKSSFTGFNDSGQFIGYGLNDFCFINPAQGVKAYGIKDTVIPFEPIYYTLGNITDGDRIIQRNNNITIIKAQSELTNVKIKFKRIRVTANTVSSIAGVTKTLSVFYNYSPDNSIPPLTIDIFSLNNNSISQLYEDYEVTIPFVNSGLNIGIGISLRDRNTVPTTTPSSNTIFQIECGDIEIISTSTALSTTIEAVRYIDLIKQVYKNIGDFPVIAKRFDVGGEFYDQFCTNGKLIRQIIDEPFTVKLKDLIEHLKETAGDYQINKDNVYIGVYEDFYPNVDLGGFLETPDKDYFEKDNETYLIKNFDYKYQTFEDDRDENNTLDAIHTESEWYVPADNSKNKKDVKLPFFRDPYKFESIKRRASEKPTTADSSDDKIGILDVIRLAPNTQLNFIKFLQYQTTTVNIFRVLSDGTFSWKLIGMGINDIITINGLTYRITNINDTVLTLALVVANPLIPAFSGVALLNITYTITGVNYVNRTNQGLIYSANLLSPERFSNLRYSQKRNLKYWQKFLNTCGKNTKIRTLENKFFKSNGECETQFDGEVSPVIENANIDFTNDRAVTQDLINTTIIISLKRAKELLEKNQNINPDGSIGGFIRVQRLDGSVVKGFVNDLKDNWRYNECKLILEKKEENEFLIVTYDGELLTIDGAEYNIQIRYNIFNDKIQFIDENNINLCNRTLFSKVSYNGIIYNSADELAIAIGS